LQKQGKMLRNQPFVQSRIDGNAFQYTTFFLWLCLCLMLCGRLASAQAQPLKEQVLEIKPSGNELFVEPINYSVLEDEAGKLTLHDVQSPQWAASFQPAAVASTNMQHPGSAYWLRLRINSNGIPLQHWYLDLFDSHINDITFYPNAANSQQTIHTGANYPFHSRPYDYKNFLLLLPLEPNHIQTYYLRLKSTSKTSFLSRLRSEQTLAEHFQVEYSLLGVFYGVLLIMVVYNLFLCLFTKDYSYLRYALYVVSCSLLFLSEDGLGFQYLWPNYPRFNLFIELCAPPLLLFTFTQYVRHFLDLPQWLPRYDRQVQVVVSASVAFLLLDAMWLQSGVAFWLYLLPYGMLFYGALKVAQKGFRPARFVLMAHSFVAISVTFLVLRKLGINAFTNAYTVYSMNAAFVLEVVVLSYALGEKIRTIQNATIKAQGRVVKQLRKKQQVQEQLVVQMRQNEELKDQMTSELEGLVIQRTEELRQQGQTIADQNRDLLQANALLALQSQAIEKLNVGLQQDLQRSQTARVLSKEMDFGEFSQIYPDKEACLAYLAETKWADGYRCRKCGHGNYCEGREPFARRCTRCRYVESATAYTLLQKCKFPIVKAFYAVFLLYTHKGNFSALEFSRILDLRRATCWSFSQKVIQAMGRLAAHTPWEAGSWTQLLLDSADGNEADEEAVSQEELV
jgi:hypothetical protein